MLDMLIYVIAPQLLTGLSIGVAIGIMAIGLSLIFGMLEIINMAHGMIYTIGAYIAVVLLHVGVGFWLALLVAPLLLILIAYLLELYLVRPVFHSPERHTLTLMVTLGVAIILEEVMRLIFGADPISLESGISGVFNIFGVVFPKYRLVVIMLGVIIMIGVWLIIFKTSIGSIIRAASEDPKMTSSMGLKVSRVYAHTFAFGCFLAGLAGVLLAPIYSVFPTMGDDFLLLAFSVIIIGGIRSVGGTIVTALMVGVIISMMALFISPVWSDPIIFAMMIVILLVKPEGLFGFGSRR